MKKITSAMLVLLASLPSTGAFSASISVDSFWAIKSIGDVATSRGSRLTPYDRLTLKQISAHIRKLEAKLDTSDTYSTQALANRVIVELRDFAERHSAQLSDLDQSRLQWSEERLYYVIQNIALENRPKTPDQNFPLPSTDIYGKDENFAALEGEAQSLVNCVQIPSRESMESELRDAYHLNPSISSVRGSFNLDGFQIANSKDQVNDLNTLTASAYPIGLAANSIVSSGEYASNRKVRTSGYLEVQYQRSYDLSPYQNQNPSCHDIVCAVKLIFGAETGVKLLWTYKKLSLNLSRYQTAGAIDFSESELNAMIKARLLLPEHLAFNVGHGIDGEHQNGFFRLPPGRIVLFENMGLWNILTALATEGSGVIALAYGAILDQVEALSDAGKAYVFFHEMGHRSASFNNQLDDEGQKIRWDASSAWYQAADWNCVGTQCTQTEVPVSRYAGVSAAEDFAESFALYRFAPIRLANTYPRIYRYLRDNVYKGVQYGANVCSETR